MNQILNQVSIALTVDGLSSDDFSTIENLVLQSPTAEQSRFLEHVGVEALGVNSTT